MKPVSVQRSAAFRIATDGVPIVVVLAWYFFSLRLPEYVLPNPIRVLERTFDLLGGNPALAWHTLFSLSRVLLSVVLAVAIGSALSLIAYYFEITRGLLIDRLLPVLNAFPTIGWAVLGLYWIGATDSAVLFVQVAILLPFAMINIWEGLKTLDEDTMEMAQSFTRNRWKVLGKIVMPMLLPFYIASFRISYGVAWKVAIIAELFGSSVGIGYLMNAARQDMDSPLVFASIVTLIILVFVVDKLVFEKIEHQLDVSRRGHAQANSPQGG